MCVVIDACFFEDVIKAVTGVSNDFTPVYNWIKDKKSGAKVVYGGSKYKQEMKDFKEIAGEYIDRVENLFKWLNALGGMGKVCRLDDNKVDAIEKKLLKDIPYSKKKGAKKDDHHIVAILLECGSWLVCTKDSNCEQLIIDFKVFYPDDLKSVCVYKTSGNKGLLVAGNIAGCCK